MATLLPLVPLSPITAAHAQGAPPSAPRPVQASALAQIRTLAEEKRSRTPAQRKIDSNLL
jgi:hypothetical protein